MNITLLAAATGYLVGGMIAGHGLVSKRKDWDTITDIGLVIMLVSYCVGIGEALLAAWLGIQ